MQSDGVNADIALREVDRPVPGSGQMLIRVKAAGLNRGEFILGHGLHKAGTAKQIGMEAAGEIVACGDGVTGFWYLIDSALLLLLTIEIKEWLD